MEYRLPSHSLHPYYWCAYCCHVYHLAYKTKSLYCTFPVWMACSCRWGMYRMRWSVLVVASASKNGTCTIGFHCTSSLLPSFRSIQECNDVESSIRKSQLSRGVYDPASGWFLSLNWLVVDVGEPLPSLVKGCGSWPVKVDDAKPKTTSIDSDCMKKLEGKRYHSPQVQTTVVEDVAETLSSSLDDDSTSLVIASGSWAYTSSGAE